MPRQLIRVARALTPTSVIADAAIIVSDGVIENVGPRQGTTASGNEYDATAYTAIPGFVDIHIHGAGARDVMEASPEALRTVTEAVARRGTTTLLATTVSAPIDATCRSLEGISRYIESSENGSTGRAEITGIHLEGPFISAARRGVHPEDALAPPSVPVLRKFQEAAKGKVRQLTIAPELPGALEVIASAAGDGITVGIGHTDSKYVEACAGIERGAVHAVHVFNAMRPFSHRETGVLGAVLTDNRVSAEIIADGVHVDDAAIRLLLAAKGSGQIILISDGTAATGMPDGKYHLGPFEFTVSGGVCRNAEGRLAGSTLTLDRALRHMVSLEVPLTAAVQMATLNPARRIGVETTKGVLASGADADLILLNQELEIVRVMARGAWIS